jgi:hypothetical protein
MSILLAGSLLYSTAAGTIVSSPSSLSLPQTLNPAYLSDMPAPARIINEIKGKDAEDTIERQMGAFMALNKMIDDMAWGLEHRYLPTRITPDELKIKDKYSLAYADLWHTAAKKEDHLYDHDRELLGELLSKFFSQKFRDLYDKSDTNAAAYYKAYREKMSGVVLSIGPAGSAPPQQDEVEKLCAAKGLNMFTCMAQGMLTGVMKLAEAGAGPPTPGLRISGFYKAGNFSMRLDQQGSNAWVNCGDVTLISDYDVLRKNDQILVKLNNADDPITLTLRPDGTTLIGPSSVPIHGHAPGGGSTTTTTAGSTQQVTTTQQRTLTPLEAQQYPGATQNGQTYTINETTTSTQYTPGSTSSAPAPWPSKTAPCKLGVLSAQPALPAQTEKKSDGLAGLLDGVIPPSPFVPNGLRMAGTYYGQGGAQIEFLADKAILGCHVTLAEHPYTVTFKAGQLLINLDGFGAPKGFTLGTDGVLHGDNSALYIRGHKKTGEDALGDPTYATSSDTCGYGTLGPRGEKQN